MHGESRGSEPGVLNASVAELLDMNRLPKNLLVKYAGGVHAGRTPQQARAGAPPLATSLIVPSTSTVGPARTPCECPEGTTREARHCLTCKVTILGRELTQAEQKKKERMAHAAVAATTELDRRQEAAAAKLGSRKNSSQKAGGRKRMCGHGRRWADCVPCKGSNTCTLHSYSNKSKCAGCRKASACRLGAMAAIAATSAVRPPPPPAEPEPVATPSTAPTAPPAAAPTPDPIPFPAVPRYTV